VKLGLHLGYSGAAPPADKAGAEGAEAETVFAARGVGRGHLVRVRGGRVEV
jgi:hypothetical protein